jgi:hypothetical protein
VSTSVYLLNRAPTKSIIGKTPYKAYYDCKASVAHVKVVTLHLSKLTDRSKQMVFIDYDMNTKGYRVSDPATR